MLTKSDIKIIKDLLKGFATKDDLIGLAKGTEIDNLRITFIDKLEQWKNELYSKIDPILTRVKTAEEENTILQAKETGRQEEREKNEQRIKQLESIHPGGHHPS